MISPLIVWLQPPNIPPYTLPFLGRIIDSFGSLIYHLQPPGFLPQNNLIFCQTWNYFHHHTRVYAYLIENIDAFDCALATHQTLGTCIFVIFLSKVQNRFIALHIPIIFCSIEWLITTPCNVPITEFSTVCLASSSRSFNSFSCSACFIQCLLLRFDSIVFTSII